MIKNYYKVRQNLLKSVTGITKCDKNLLKSETMVTKNNIVWKIARGYCLCYCKTFSLVPDSTECIKLFLPKYAVHYLYHLKSNNIIGQRKTTNTEKYFYL